MHAGPAQRLAQLPLRDPDPGLHRGDRPDIRVVVARVQPFRLVKELESGVNDLKESSRVQAVVDWCGPTDFLEMGNAESDQQHNASDSPESKLIGGALLQNKDKAAKASPTSFSPPRPTSPA